MLDRNKLYYLLTDANNPVWNNFSNNAEFLHLANYIADNYSEQPVNLSDGRHLNLNDGCYMELFAVKDGKRYNLNIVGLRDVSIKLTNSLMDGIEKLWE